MRFSRFLGRNLRTKTNSAEMIQVTLKSESLRNHFEGEPEHIWQLTERNAWSVEKIEKSDAGGVPVTPERTEVDLRSSKSELDTIQWISSSG